MEYKICQMCKQRPASVHVAQLSNSEYVSVDLCEDCAEKKGVASSSSAALSAHVSLVDLFETLLKKEHKKKDEDPLEPKLVCPGCQRSYQDFRESGRFGCALCYNSFSSKLTELLPKIQRSSVHCGKVPELSKATYQRQIQMLEYRRKLRNAVGNEEFDEAARLRDHIRELEEQVS